MKCLAATQGAKLRINSILPGLLLTDWVRAPTRNRRTLANVIDRAICTALNESPCSRIEQC